MAGDCRRVPPTDGHAPAITAGQSYRATYYGGIDVPQAKVLDCKASLAGNTLMCYPQLHYLVMCDRGCSHTIHSPHVPHNACTPTPNACMSLWLCPPASPVHMHML